MDAQGFPQDATLADLLEAGSEALALGETRAAHEIWRAAAVANPYDEHVWLLLLKVLKDEEDRKVCLENIISINPLNTVARRQYRLLIHREQLRDEARQTAEKATIAPLPRSQARKRGSQSLLVRALLTGIGIGLFAVALGIIVSIVVYGGLLPTAAF